MTGPRGATVGGRRADRRDDRSEGLGPDRPEVQVATKPGGQGLGRPFGVVARPEESAVDRMLDPSADGLEQRERHQRGRGHRQGLALGDVGQDRLQADDGADEDRHEDARDQRPADRPADDPVDLEQPVARDRDPDRVGTAK